MLFGYVNSYHGLHIYLGCGMITINIACVGNLKEKYWKDAIDEYQKRLSAFAKINIFEVKESDYGTSKKQILIAKAEEAERLKKYTLGYVVALEIDGKTFDSVQFAEHVQNLMINGNSTITFLIGGSHGLDKTLSDSANEKLSFSKFTFPHQLMRVILIEQIYRAFTILNNKTYHK